MTTLSPTLPICEEFYSIQGEGVNCGSAAYFVRLAGCDVKCPWCDTKQSWNTENAKLCTVDEIAARAAANPSPNVVITGGEPLIHNLAPLCERLEQKCLSVWLETSGTHHITGSFDWICLSPKKHHPPLDEVLEQANELKVVISTADDLAFAEQCAAKAAAECVLVLQPEWDNRQQSIQLIFDYVLKHPVWKVSTQMHKYIGVR